MRKIIVSVLLCLPMVALAKTNYHTQVNHFALKKGQEWSWKSVAKTPNIKWQRKSPIKHSDLNYYYAYGDMGEWGDLTVSGSKNKPLIVEITSAQSYARSENGADVYGLYQLFKKSELTKLQSNCSVDENTDRMSVGEYQHFYKWQRQGYQPLYLGVRRFQAGSFSGGISMSYIIVKDFDLFNNQSVMGLERYDIDGNDIVCHII